MIEKNHILDLAATLHEEDKFGEKLPEDQFLLHCCSFDKPPPLLKPMCLRNPANYTFSLI